MRALLVVMPDMLFEELLEVALTEYEDVIQRLSTYGAHEAFGDALAFGERIGVRTTRTPSERNRDGH